MSLEKNRYTNEPELNYMKTVPTEEKTNICILLNKCHATNSK